MLRHSFHLPRVIGVAALLALLLGTGASSAEQGRGAARLEPLGHNDLGGPQGGGKGGEGIALMLFHHSRYLFTAAESGPNCFSVVDVTDPSRPQLVTQVDVPNPNVRCNSLDLSGSVLAVVYQVAQAGQQPAGLRLYDVSDPANPTALGFFDTSGPHSRGAHHVWFVDGHYAYLSTGSADFTPTNPNDDQFLMIVDVSDSRNPHEVGRWWYPGTRVGDPVPPPPRNPALDSGYRLHNIDVYPDHPNLAYLGYIDGGVVILDISDKQHPVPVSVGGFDPPASVGFTHTVVPFFSRDLLIVSNEETTDRCAEAQKRVWTWDATPGQTPRPIFPLPLPADADQLCMAGGRFGAHNIWENRPGDLAFHSERLVLGSFFNGGARLYDTCDPSRPEELASYVPAGPPGSAAGTIQFNHVYWDERGIGYAVDRLAGGLYTFGVSVPPALLSTSGCKSG
jgi:hypothetical protein